MGRTGKLKKKSSSVHSRAARRADSPSSNADKSLESMPRVEAPKKAQSILAAHANSGISKKKAKDKKLTRAQRLRQQKGIERAEVLFDRLETKVEKAKQSHAKVATVRKEKWEDLNGKQVKPEKSLKQTQESGSDVDGMDEDEHLSPAVPVVSSGIPVTETLVTSIPSQEVGAVDEDDNIT